MCEVSGYSQTLTDVPEAAHGAARRGGRHGDIVRRVERDGTCCTRPLSHPTGAGWAIGVVDCCLVCVPIFQSKAAFFRSNSGRNGKTGRL